MWAIHMAYTGCLWQSLQSPACSAGIGLKAGAMLRATHSCARGSSLPDWSPPVTWVSAHSVDAIIHTSKCVVMQHLYVHQSCLMFCAQISVESITVKRIDHEEIFGRKSIKPGMYIIMLDYHDAV